MGLIRKVASVGSLGLIPGKTHKQKERAANAELAHERALLVREERRALRR